MFILNLIVFLIVLGVIVLIHEFGHYIVAKKFGVLVFEFAFGMGPLLYGKKKGETQYSIRAIPLGGFCAMGGEDINKALIKKNQTIGLLLDENGNAKEILLSSNLESSVSGVVTDFDLYGDNNSNLFITLLVSEEEHTYNVNRDAVYVEKTLNIFKKEVKKQLQIVPKERSFESKPAYQRFLVLIAGVTLNFILALFIFMLLNFVDVNRYKPSQSNVIGSSNYEASTILKTNDKIISINGIDINNWDEIGLWKNTPSTYESVTLNYERDGVIYQNNVINTVISVYAAGIYNIDSNGKIRNADKDGNRAAIVGQVVDISKDLKEGDKIVAINSEVVNNWDDVINYFRTNTNGGKTAFHIIRDDKEVTVNIEAYSQKLLKGQGINSFEVSIGLSPIQHFDFGYALKSGFKEFGSNAIIIFTTLGQLFSGTVKITQLSGPVGIFQVVGSAMKGGINSILFIIGLLSVNVGIMNLLPIPALDGGRVLFLIIEAITRKKVNRKVESIINNVFYIALLAFMAVIIVLDVLKLF
ncbi:MAG: RIP metalloprotease RseP [Acholeplasmatales bacterium]|nr:RIP metalloprotease RseP [Acholeplasmatales bacterium]